MQNDSLETLLLRHYGSGAQAPIGLEEKLYAATRAEAMELGEQQMVATQLRERRVSRRYAVRLVAIGTAGIGGLRLPIGGFRMSDASSISQETSKPATASSYGRYHTRVAMLQSTFV